MSSKNDFLEVAIRELSHQTYASTQQCLAEHSIEILDGKGESYRNVGLFFGFRFVFHVS